MSTGSYKPSKPVLMYLWQEAPIWRVLLIAALILTVFLVLYPPQLPSNLGPHASTETASFTPPPAPTHTVVAAPPAEPAPTPVAPPVIPPVNHAPPASSQPVMAGLSLQRPSSTPSGNANNDTGLDDALVGQLYTGSISVYGYEFPLPPGHWVRLANTTAKTQTSAGMIYFLGQIRNKRLMKAIVVGGSKSTSNPPAGFSITKDCNAHLEYNHVSFVEEGSTPGGHEACWIMSNAYTVPWQQWGDNNVKMNPLYRAMAGDMAAKGASYNQDYVTLGFGRAESWGMLYAVYYFNPEEDHITAAPVLSFAESEWTAANYSRYPDKVAYIQKIKNWALEHWPQFNDVFAKAETVTSPTLVSTPTTPSPSPTPAQPQQQIPIPQAQDVNPNHEPDKILSMSAKSAVKLRIYAAWETNIDCSNKGYPSYSLIRAPAHGHLVAEHGPATPNFAKDSPRASCNETGVPAALLYYTANSDYVGPDTLIARVSWPNNNVKTVTFNIDVVK